ncbi:MAG TPA: hypothetical protein VII08_00520 [Myxococcales bacterium]
MGRCLRTKGRGIARRLYARLKRPLFVDDNIAFADNLAEILREKGAEVWPSPRAPPLLEVVEKLWR